MSYSANALFGKRALYLISAEDYIDWAGESLVEGYDSFHLRILAGLERSASAYEAEAYFLRCINELAFSVPDTEVARCAYACEMAQKIVDGEISGVQGIRAMYQLCLASAYEHDFIIWLELDDALDNLLAGEYPFTYTSATLENIEMIANVEAKKFVELMQERLAASRSLSMN